MEVSILGFCNCELSSALYIFMAPKLFCNIVSQVRWSVHVLVLYISCFLCNCDSFNGKLMESIIFYSYHIVYLSCIALPRCLA